MADGSEKKMIFLNAYVIGALVFVTILAILFIAKPLSFFHVRGSSMNPTLHDNDLVLCLNTKKIDYGDIVAFKHENNSMIKRVIGKPGDEINIDSSGNVYRNGKLLEEEYVRMKSLGGIEIKLPYIVPENSYFVLGDNRVDSLDSRLYTIGCIKEKDIVGKILFK